MDVAERRLRQARYTRKTTHDEETAYEIIEREERAAERRCQTLLLIDNGPPLKPDLSSDKMDFLAAFGLTANSVAEGRTWTANFSLHRSPQRRRSWEVGVLTPWKYVGGVRVLDIAPLSILYNLGSVSWVALTVVPRRKLVAAPRANGLLGPQYAASRHTTPQSTTLGLHPVIRVPNYMDQYSFADPWGIDGWVGHVGWPIADGLTTQWSPIQLAVWRRIGKVRRPRPAF